MFDRTLVHKAASCVSIKKAGEFARKLDHPEKLFVRYAIQDQLRRNNYDYSVDLAELDGAS